MTEFRKWNISRKCTVSRSTKSSLFTLKCDWDHLWVPVCSNKHEYFSVTVKKGTILEEAVNSENNLLLRISLHEKRILNFKSICMIKRYSFMFSVFSLFPIHARYSSTLGQSNFGHGNINLYNNYASASYSTYTAPQYTTANPNRCPPNANIKPTCGGSGSGSGGGGAGSSSSSRLDHRFGSNKSSSYRFGHHVQRKSRFDNGSGSDTVVANRHDRSYNESVIEEGHNNNFVSTSRPHYWYYYLPDSIELYAVRSFAHSTSYASPRKQFHFLIDDVLQCFDAHHSNAIQNIGIWSETCLRLYNC